MARELRSESAHITVYEDPYSKRLRIDDYSGNFDGVLTLIDRSILPWVDKLIVKSRNRDVAAFEKTGYRQEARVKKYFSGEDMVFVTRYFAAARRVNTKEQEEEKLISRILGESLESISPRQSCSFATADDADELAALYRRTFKVYPTPVGDPDHVRKTLLEGTLYVFIREGGQLISAASAEINRQYGNAELTDCATADEARGRGLMRVLLTTLEQTLKVQGITCLYTIARSESYGMNKVFHQLGYTYGGRMTNNCMIYSGLEDMNVWYKS